MPVVLLWVVTVGLVLAGLLVIRRGGVLFGLVLIAFGLFLVPIAPNPT